MLVLSPMGAFSATASRASFSAGTLSPVSADSSDFKLTLSRRRASAGTKSPASRKIISPGTSSLAAMICSFPSRSTLACGADMFFSASSAFSALLSCTSPITALRMAIKTMRMGSTNSMGSPSPVPNT